MLSKLVSLSLPLGLATASIILDHAAILEIPLVFAIPSEEQRVEFRIEVSVEGHRISLFDYYQKTPDPLAMSLRRELYVLNLNAYDQDRLNRVLRLMQEMKRSNPQLQLRLVRLKNQIVENVQNAI